MKPLTEQSAVLTHSNLPSASHNQSDRIVRRPTVEQTTGLSRATIYESMARGEFPSAIRIGKRAVGWSALEIAEWLESRARTISANRVKPKVQSKR